MSNSEAPTEPNPTPPSRDNDARPPHDAGPDAPPAESLWKPGKFTFIDDKVKTDAEKTILRAKTGNAERAEANGNGARDSGSGEVPTTVPAGDTTTAESTPSKRPRKVTDMASMLERPDWLPEGWSMKCKVRSSGASAGCIDRYYLDPVSGRRFRSKNEVYHFLETGSKLKKKPNPDGDDLSSGNAGAKKAKKSGSTAKLSPPPNFNFNNPPKEVSWVLMDACMDTWSPFIGGEEVSESTKREWRAAFDYLNSLKGNKRPS